MVVVAGAIVMAIIAVWAAICLKLSFDPAEPQGIRETDRDILAIILIVAMIVFGGFIGIALL